MNISIDYLNQFLNKGVENSGRMMRRQSNVSSFIAIFFLIYFVSDVFIRLGHPFEILPLIRNLFIISILCISLFLSIKKRDSYNAPLVTLLGFSVVFPFSCYLYGSTLLGKVCIIILPLIAALIQLRYKWKLVLLILPIIGFFIANLSLGQSFYKDSFLITCTIPIFAVALYFYENLREYSAARVNLIKELENKVLELKHKNKELQGKNKELEQFNYITSHDLQEPLLTITSFSKLMSNRYDDVLDERGKRCLTHIQESSTRMSDLIKALLDYSMIGNSKTIEKVDLNQLLGEVRENLKQEIEDTKIQLDIASLPTIKGFRKELVLLFENLISNAIKFRKEDDSSQIQISVEDKIDKWHFSISDNGIGIDKEHHSKIFNMFQRLYNREKYVGSGVGLAHCKKIVNLHKGEITVESEEEKGSTFNFTILKELDNE